MPQTHSEALASFEKREVSIIRWFELDQILYVYVSPSIKQIEIDNIKKDFIGCDYFNSYNLFAIDLSKQLSQYQHEEIIIKKFKKRSELKFITDFQL